MAHAAGPRPTSNRSGYPSIAPSARRQDGQHAAPVGGRGARSFDFHVFSSAVRERAGDGSPPNRCAGAVSDNRVHGAACLVQGIFWSCSMADMGGASAGPMRTARAPREVAIQSTTRPRARRTRAHANLSTRRTRWGRAGISPTGRCLTNHSSCPRARELAAAWFERCCAALESSRDQPPSAGRGAEPLHRAAAGRGRGASSRGRRSEDPHGEHRIVGSPSTNDCRHPLGAAAHGRPQGHQPSSPVVFNTSKGTPRRGPAGNPAIAGTITPPSVTAWITTSVSSAAGPWRRDGFLETSARPSALPKRGSQKGSGHRRDDRDPAPSSQPGPSGSTNQAALLTGSGSSCSTRFERTACRRARKFFSPARRRRVPARRSHHFLNNRASRSTRPCRARPAQGSVPAGVLRAPRSADPRKRVKPDLDAATRRAAPGT